MRRLEFVALMVPLLASAAAQRRERTSPEIGDDAGAWVFWERLKSD